MSEENGEKDDDDDFWLKTCDSFVVQLAETQEKKKVKSPIKRKLLKEQLPQPPKRKYTKRIKVEPVSESENDKKVSVSVETASKQAETVKISPIQEKKTVSDEKSVKAELLDVDKENKTKLEDREKKTDDVKHDVKQDDEKQLTKVTKPKRKRVLKLKFPKPILIAKINKIKMKERKGLKLKEKKEGTKEEKKELKRGEKPSKKELLQQQKSEKTKDVSLAKEEKKGLKKEEKRDLKKDQQQEGSGSAGKKDLGHKKEGKKVEANRKKTGAEKENVTKNSENTTRRAAAAAAAATIFETAGKFNPRQSLRRKNSLKDYTFAFDELLDDAFVQFEADKVPVRRRRKCASPSPSGPASAAVTSSGGAQVTADAAAGAAVVKKSKEKGIDNETIRMRLRSRNRPLQEPQQAAKKKGNAKMKIMPKRRRKKSLGEKSVPSPAADDWKDELYKFKRSLRLPSKLISVVSPPSAGAVAPDQVSLTSIMNIPVPPKLVKEGKTVKSTSQSQGAAVIGKKAKQRLGHLFGRRDVFKGRRLMKREKIVSAEKLMQRNLRKRRQREGEEKKGVEGGCAGEEATAPVTTVASVDDDDDDEDEEDNEEKAPSRVMFKRKFMRKKFRSGFDYIKKKKKKEPASEKKPSTTTATAVATQPPPNLKPRFVSEIQADIKGWIVNKGHGETVLHRAARLGVKVSFFVIIDV